MTEPNLDGRGSANDSIRETGSPADAQSMGETGAGKVLIQPLDQIAPRGDGAPDNDPPFARTFRLSLRHSFNELLKPLHNLLPEHDVIPAWVGGGYDVLRCGHCDFAIAECVDIEQMRRQTLYCPRCAAENQVP